MCTHLGVSDHTEMVIPELVLLTDDQTKENTLHHDDAGLVQLLDHILGRDTNCANKQGSAAFNDDVR